MISPGPTKGKNPRRDGISLDDIVIEDVSEEQVLSPNEETAPDHAGESDEFADLIALPDEADSGRRNWRAVPVWRPGAAFHRDKRDGPRRAPAEGWAPGRKGSQRRQSCWKLR